jgi:predicted HicB family RNase H-like nuclease
MFRVKIEEESTSKTFRMPNNLLKKLEKLADEKNISLSKLVIQCCEYAMENLDKEKSTK